ncbi:restriction endonuclease [Streptomyces sp. NBC_00237]|uniref:restriction endonuclease n=1 Tax=Streptomyces sp. NBC_00237 TaxID=2975687 RepID=UPI0022556977|nr:restriction endonuclease [Streptomyces sp. NBC_00237]MCX5205833.1 restriction endonuclease [Streptomyces sp. NBC_00237]
MTAYRERVHDLYESAADDRCGHFVLWKPVEPLIVVSLTGEWVFARPSASDATTLVERWEDPLLARYSAITRADSAAHVQQVLCMDHGYVMVQRHELNQVHFELDVAPSSHLGHAAWAGAQLADAHAQSSAQQVAIERAVAALTGYSLDHEQLALLRRELGEISLQRGGVRGRAFEEWMFRLLLAHGCRAERGIPHGGEQLDFLVLEPFHAVMECRWKQSRLQPGELSDLRGKLAHRPALVAGIYVSMSGFTPNTAEHAAREAHSRAVLLWGLDDVQQLLSGSVHVQDLFKQHVAAHIRGY